MDTIDLLAFGSHPDDIEIGLGGAVARHVALGARVGLCDLTAGEQSSNGSVDERLAEGDAAAGVLGVAWRRNLRLPDGHLGGDEQVRAVVEEVRRWRPRAVAAPYWTDRHPDHAAASRLVALAVFKANLRRFEAAGAPWQADWVCYYFINDGAVPSFVIDVSAHYERKRQALACHRSQFASSSDHAVETRLTSPRFQQLIESRDAQFGALVGVAFAEGIVVREPVMRPNLFRESGRTSVEKGGRS